MSALESADLALWAASAYPDDEIDNTHRALRDAAKFKYFAGDSDWRLVMERAEQSPASGREYAATQVMFGRILFAEGMVHQEPEQLDEAAQRLREAVTILKLLGNTLRPDQYRINFAALESLADTYSTEPRRSRKSAVTHALVTVAMGFASESRALADSVADLPKKAMFKSKARAITRGGVAAAAALASSNSHVKRAAIRVAKL